MTYAQADEPDSMTVDYDKLMNHMDSDTALLGQLVTLFRDFYPSQLEVIRAAIHRNDLPQFREATRYLNGAVSNFHAPKASEVLTNLLRVGTDRPIHSANDLVQKLDHEVDQLFDALEEICASQLS